VRIDTIRSLGNFVIAIIVIVGGFVFLDRLLHDLQNPDLAAIDAATVGIVVGGVMAIISSVVTSLFTNESARGAARSVTNATEAGVAAAMTTPPSASVTVDNLPTDPIPVTTDTQP
jgi:MFS family permease